MKILLPGASGFIGSFLLEKMSNHEVTAIGRRKIDCCNSYYYRELTGTENYSDCLLDVDVVIHAAARAHVLIDRSKNTLVEYRKVNTEGTLNLASQASKLGVKRFIYLSSIGVNGNISNKPFTESDFAAPHNDYALSKYEAELGLIDISIKTNMEIVIIRPPLVYGPNPPGNFSTLLGVIKKSYPLPLACITQNKRSLIALENLVDFILLCANYKKTPQAANQTFLISDGEDVSTAELFKRVAKAYGKRSWLLPFPPLLLHLGAKVLGKQDMANSLLASLQVDNSKAYKLLGWKPLITMDEQLQKIVEYDEEVAT